MAGAQHMLVIIRNLQCLPPGPVTLIIQGVGVGFSEENEPSSHRGAGWCRKAHLLSWLQTGAQAQGTVPGLLLEQRLLRPWVCCLWFGVEAFAGPAWGELSVTHILLSVYC